MTKAIGGIATCRCDRRYKPVIVRSGEMSPSTYCVKCLNCGKVGPGAVHHPFDSHIAAKKKAVKLWNEREST